MIIIAPVSFFIFSTDEGDNMTEKCGENKMAWL